MQVSGGSLVFLWLLLSVSGGSNGTVHRLLTHICTYTLPLHIPLRTYEYIHCLRWQQWHLACTTTARRATKFLSTERLASMLESCTWTFRLSYNVHVRGQIWFQSASPSYTYKAWKINICSCRGWGACRTDGRGQRWQCTTSTRRESSWRTKISSISYSGFPFSKGGIPP